MNLTSLEALIYTDGASRGNPGDSGAGIVIKDGEKTIKEIKKILMKKKRTCLTKKQNTVKSI